MSGPGKRFPLNLASLDSAGKKNASSAVSRPLAGKQTAARNAASASSASVLTGHEHAERVARPERTDFIAHGAAGSLANRGAVSNDVSGRKSDVRQQAMVSDGVRIAMVDRIARQGVRDPAVLSAMQAVLRHTFIDSGLVGQAYIDASLPIGHQQTISQPYIVARMIELMRENAGESPMANVLEIGTGCGYQAAVLSKIARQVYSIERIRPLHELAKNNLRPYRIANLRLHYGDGMLGLPTAAPFDGIILAAAGMDIPEALLQQMTVGGRLVAPVGSKAQVLRVIERSGRNEWVSRDVESCHFVPLLSGMI